MPRRKRNALITCTVIAGLLIVLLAAYAIPRLQLIGRLTIKCMWHSASTAIYIILTVLTPMTRPALARTSGSYVR